MRPRLTALLPVIGVAAGALVLVVLVVVLPGDGVSVFVVRLVEFVLAGGAAYLLDDGAALMTTVTPRNLWQRRAPMLLGGATMLAASWAVILLILHAQDPSLPLLALTGETAVLGALAVSLASVLVWRGEPQPGGQVAPLVGICGITALIAEPLLRATIFVPVDESSGVMPGLAWAVAGLLAVIVTVVSSRDPAAR